MSEVFEYRQVALMSVVKEMFVDVVPAGRVPVGAGLVRVGGMAAFNGPM